MSSCQRIALRLGESSFGCPITKNCKSAADLSASSKDSTIRIYDRSTLSLQHLLTAHTGPVNSLSLHPDASVRHLVSASGDGSYLIHHLHTGQLLSRSDPSHQGRGLACVSWEKQGIMTGDNDKSIKLWDVEKGEVKREWKGSGELVRCLSGWEEEGCLVSGGYDRKVRIWGMGEDGSEDGKKRGRELAGLGEELVFDVKVRGCRMFTSVFPR